MLVTLKSGIQIIASRIAFQTGGVQDDEHQVLIYFDSVQDILCTPSDPKKECYSLHPFIINDSKNPYTFTMFVQIDHEKIKSITDEGVDR